MNWQEYQDAVGELYAQMDNIGNVRKNITLPDKITGQARQIDVWLEYELKGHTISILIDAKYRKEKLDVKDVEEVFALANAVGADKSVIVALSGWTEPAQIKAESIGMDLKLWTLDQALNATVPNKKVKFLLSLLDSEDERYKHQAINDLAEFGIDASIAIPQLIKILEEKDKQLSNSASIALSKIGVKSVASLASLLDSNDLDIKRIAASTLEQIGEQAREAIPQLIKVIEDNDSDEEVRWYAVITIGKIGIPAKGAIPSLIKALQDPEPGVRAWSLYALGQMREFAKDAESIILELIPQELPNAIGNSVFMAGVEALDAIGFDIDVISVASPEDTSVQTAREWVVAIRESNFRAKELKREQAKNQGSIILEWRRPLSVGTPPQKSLEQFRKAHGET
ncbi:hypothetical protein BST81_09145 [Leptolyngbya sp. 'hensonii']|uniref:HEAT repeat domain-containing protein n=1 Tax=Leptolyngbya sp. 'hensonii' TaxID=1922337 RepID=UPI00094FBCA3|nr:HEAT repeat domain-containing protein [Leptolyngbya sp. 'hensonii']OLP18736.1 hypothetical protein BST81_09145 [Leptolyngbya sp. 'hensonii']